MKLRVARIVPITEAEGPGRRFAIWVQGCTIRCPGCCNPHLFSKEGGADLETSEIVAQIRAVAGLIEGLTLLGGEPFEQAEPLAEIAQAARAMGLSVMTFTGFLREELEGNPLLRATDLLVDGRFEAAQPETERRWAGSRNQRFHFLTQRYAPGVERGGERTVEVRFQGDRVEINGWPVLFRLP